MTDWIDIQKDPAHVTRERNKARELRKTAWWRSQLDRGICHYCHGKFPPEELSMGDREQLLRILRAHGTDRVLFGSDSPWGEEGEELAVLRGLGLSGQELQAVCGGNAARLLGL